MLLAVDRSSPTSSSHRITAPIVALAESLSDRRI